MAKAKSKVPVGKVLEVLSEGSDAMKGQDEQIRIRVHVDDTCPRELVCAVRDALVAERAGGIVEVRPLAWGRTDELPADVALVLVGSASAQVADVARSHARSGVPVALVAETTLVIPELDLPEECKPYAGVVCASDPAALPNNLASWLVQATDKDLALAANFSFCRGEVVKGLVNRCALENAAVGAVDIIHGADLPVMTVNQAKLALDIAAAYGRGVDLSRAVELAGVVGAGYAYRAVTRTLVGILPGIEHIVRGAMGYAGTQATGNALRLRFEAEDRLLLGRGEDDEQPQTALALRPASVGEVAHVRTVSAPAPTTPEPPSGMPQEDEPHETYLVFGDDGLVGEES